MKYYVLSACLVVALSAPNCQKVNVELRRVASTETRFPKDDICDDSAKAYAKRNSIPLPQPISPSLSPKVYSFPKGIDSLKEEILYKTSQLKPAEITYYEISIASGNDAANEIKLKEFINALPLSQFGIEVIQSPTRDEYLTNGKYPYRAVLNTKIPLPINLGSGENKKKRVELKGDFGLIINPPYPP